MPPPNVNIDQLAQQYQIILVDHTSDPNADGIPSGEINTEFGTPLSYGVTGFSILVSSYLNSRGIGPGSLLGNRVLGPLGNRISPQAGGFMREMAFQGEFLAVIRFMFPVAEAGQNGNINAYTLNNILGKSWGPHADPSGEHNVRTYAESALAGLAAFGVYSAIQTGFQRSATNGIDANLFQNGRWVSAANGRPLLHRAAVGLSTPIRSSAARTALNGYLGAAETLSAGRGGTKLLMIVIGSGLGWAAWDQTVNQLDSDRLELYYETPEIVLDNYTNSPFSGTIMGFTIGGHLGFGGGMALGDLLGSVAARLTPASLSVYMEQRLLTPEQVNELAKISETLQESAKKVKDRVSLSPETGRVYLNDNLGARTRGHLAWNAISSDQADSNRENVHWTRDVQSRMIRRLDSAYKSLSSAFSRLSTSFDGILNLETWDRLWGEADTPAKKEALLKQMRGSASELQKSLAKAKADIQASIRQLEKAPFTPGRDDEGRRVQNRALGDGVLNTEIPKQIEGLQKLLARIEAAEQKLKKLPSGESSWFENGWRQASNLLSDESSKRDSQMEALNAEFKETRALLEAAHTEASEIGESAKDSLLKEINERKSRLVEGVMPPEVDKSLRSYERTVAKLRVELAELAGLSEESMKTEDMRSRLVTDASENSAREAAWLELTEDQKALEKAEKKNAAKLRQLQIEKQALEEQQRRVQARGTSPEALRRLGADIEKLNARINELIYGREADGTIKTSGDPLLVETTKGSNQWQSPRLKEVNEQLRKMNGEGLTEESARVLARNQEAMGQKLAQVRETTRLAIVELTETIREAEREGMPESEVNKMNEALEGWKEVDRKLNCIENIPELKAGWVARIFEGPRLARVREVITGSSLWKTHKNFFRGALRTGGRGAGSLATNTLMVGGNLLAGSYLAMKMEELFGYAFRSRTVEGSLPGLNKTDHLFLLEAGVK